MDFWLRARSFVEETAKKSQELTQGITASTLSDVVSEASKKSKELAAEASIMSKELAADALKRADQIKAHIPPVQNNLVDPSPREGSDVADLEKFGVTDELREFVKGLTINIFQDFPLEDDADVSEVPAIANVRQDLSEWQAIHANLVLTTVKEIAKLRYQLCPRVMKERRFWKTYFILVSTHVAPYEKRYLEALKLNSSDKVVATEIKRTSSRERPEQVSEITVLKNDKGKSKSSEQDLDVFLLGDHDDLDAGHDDANDDTDDDFEKV